MAGIVAPFGPPQRRQFYLISIGLFVVGFTIRLIYLNQVSELPTFDDPVMDERYHIQVADQILAGTITEEPYFRAPLYLYFLALLRSIGGESTYWSRLIQIILGSFLPCLVFLLGVKLFSRKVALTAACVAVVYPTFLYFDSSLLITSVMTLLTTIVVLSLYGCQGRKPMYMFWVSGLLLGLAALARPNILLMVPALSVWIFTVIRAETGTRSALIRYLAICTGCAVIIAPVAIRNYVVSGDYVLISWQGGFNFYLGNNNQANGWSAQAPGIDPSWSGGYREAISIAELEEGRDLMPSEISDYWYRKAWSEIKESPGSSSELLFRKARLFFNGYEIPNNQDIYFVRDYAPIMKPLLLRDFVYLPYGLLAPLAMIGFAFSLRQWRQYMIVHLTVLSYAVSLLLFFVCARFRQPILPLLILLGVFGAFQIAQQFRDRKYGTCIVLIGIFAVLAIESNRNVLGLDRGRVNAENHFMLAQVAWERGDHYLASEECYQALGHDSTFADAYANLAVIEKNRGNLQSAIDLNIQAILIDSTIVQPYQNLALMYINLGRLPSAAKILERAHSLFPANDHVLYLLGVTYARLGQAEKSMLSLQRCLEINPINSNALELHESLVDSLGG